MKKIISGISLALILVACSQVRDVSFYRSHPDERDIKLSECRSIQGAFSNDQECISAWNALEVKPVSYWSKNDSERGATTKICGEHRGTIRSSPNCENAIAAQAAVMGGGTPVYISAPK